ncbi:CAP domain-containing protein [Streptomyces sp. NPDC048350]|uniref:CAP domain-containing protein n=1 Tax=Streptomyces sp. NPDC048350 TaxID=3365538 RepID=UPI0037143D5B
MNQGIGTEQGHDTELVREAQYGDPWARDRMVATHLPLVYNIVGRALNGHHDVDALARETMLRALDGLGALRDLDAFRPWLVAIAVDGVRRHMQQAQLLGDTAGLPTIGPDFADVTVGRLHLTGQQREAAEAARWIEPEDADLLALWWLECVGELSRYEVAAALQWSVENTAARVEGMRARLDAARVVVGALATNPLCPALGYEAGTWDGRPSAAWREYLARHAAGCVHCAARWRGLVPTEALLAGLPLVPPPNRLLADVREHIGWGLAAAAASATTAYAAVAYESPAPHTGTAGGDSHEQTEQTDQADRTELIGHVDLTRPYAPGEPQETSSVAWAGPGPRASRNARRRRRQERERSRRKVAVTAGMAVVALTGGSFYLSGGRGGDGELLEANRAAAPAPDLPFAQEPNGLTPTPSTASASTSASASASATPSAKATTTSPRPTRTASSAPTRTADPRTSAPKPKTTRPGNGTGDDSGTGTGAGRQGDSGSGSAADHVISLVNAERAKAGCGPLSANATLTRAAQGHSEDMAARDYFDHTNPDGAGPGERVTAAGYPWSTYGENIAMGQSTPEQVMEGWMNSPGHRANILNCDFKEIGIGVHSEGGPYWTQVFGARRG